MGDACRTHIALAGYVKNTLSALNLFQCITRLFVSTSYIDASCSPWYVENVFPTRREEDKKWRERQCSLIFVTMVM
jgi:hypothetical protein